MAAGTGFVMGYFSSIFFPFIDPFSVAFVGAVITVLINQWLVHDSIKGKRRGTFEYVYMESLLESSISSAIASVRTEPTELVLEFESLALFKSLMSKAESTTGDKRSIYYMAAAKAANAGSEFNNEITALKQATKLKPTDLIANYRLARAYERIGSGHEAILAYEAALSDPTIDSDALRTFISSQTIRVREKGPQQASPISGLIYQLM